MFCSSCGNELAEGAAFCSACGAKVGGAASSASAASAPVAEPEGNPLQELVEGLTTEQYSISRSEGMYVISWKDAEHPNDLAIGEFDMDGTALVEELDIAATPRVLSDVYEAVVAAAQSEAGFSGNVWLCDLEDWDIIIIASADKGDFPAYSIVAKSYVSDDFSASTNSAFVQRIEGFKVGKKGMVSGLASFAFGKAREKNETAAQWGEAFDMVKGFKKEMRGGKYAKWAESVQSLVHTAFSAEDFNADVERAADYLTGDLNA